jgi:hypothetical protein
MQQVEPEALVKVLTHPRQLPEGADVLGQPTISFQEAPCLAYPSPCLDVVERPCVLEADRIVAAPQLQPTNRLACNKDWPLGLPEEEPRLVTVVAT